MNVIQSAEGFVADMCRETFFVKKKVVSSDRNRKNHSCIPDEKIQVNPRFWPGSEILF